MSIFLIATSLMLFLLLRNVKKNEGKIGFLGTVVTLVGSGSLLFLVYIMCIVIENTLMDGELREGVVFILLAMLFTGTLWVKLERVIYFYINKKHSQDKRLQTQQIEKSKEKTHDQK